MAGGGRRVGPGGHSLRGYGAAIVVWQTCGLQGVRWGFRGVCMQPYAFMWVSWEQSPYLW